MGFGQFSEKCTHGHKPWIGVGWVNETSSSKRAPGQWGDSMRHGVIENTIVNGRQLGDAVLRLSSDQRGFKVRLQCSDLGG